MSKHNHSHEEHRHAHLDEHQENVQQEESCAAQTQPQENPAPAEHPDYYDKFVRLSADFENFRKRTEREKAALIEYGKKDFAQKLLPAYEVMLREREKMEKDEQTGMLPETAGKYIAKIASKQSGKPVLIIGAQYKAVGILKKILPLRLINRIVGAIYAK